MPALSSVSPEKVATPFWAVDAQRAAEGGTAGVVRQRHGDGAVEGGVHVARAVLGGDGQAEAGSRR